MKPPADPVGGRFPKAWRWLALVGVALKPAPHLGGGPNLRQLMLLAEVGTSARSWAKTAGAFFNLINIFRPKGEICFDCAANRQTVTTNPVAP